MTDKKGEYCVVFDGVSFDRTWDNLSSVFNDHGKGEIVSYLESITSFLLKDVDDATVDDIKKLPGFKCIVPNSPGSFG